jgi:hypothetical protein
MKKTENTPCPTLTALSCPTDEAHWHTGEVALLGHTGHTITNGVLGVSVCHIFFTFKFFSKKMTKKNNRKKEAKSGDKSRASKRKQQSAPVTSGVSVPEKAKKPKRVAVERAISSISSLPAEVSKGTFASNVAEEEQKMPALLRCAAVPREVIGAGAVLPAEVKAVAPLVKAVKAQGVAREKLEEAEENKDEEDDDDDSGGGDDDEDEDEELGDEESE